MMRILLIILTVSSFYSCTQRRESYWDNGNIRSKGKVIKTLHTGRWRYYGMNGVCLKKGVYRKGVKKGIWRIYDFEGGEVKGRYVKFDSVAVQLLDSNWNNVYFEIPEDNFVRHGKWLKTNSKGVKSVIIFYYGVPTDSDGNPFPEQ